MRRTLDFDVFACVRYGGRLKGAYVKHYRRAEDWNDAWARALGFLRRSLYRA